jgi:hypothetical protein
MDMEMVQKEAQELGVTLGITACFADVVMTRRYSPALRAAPL